MPVVGSFNHVIFYSILKRSSSSAVVTGWPNGLKAPCLCQCLSLFVTDCGDVRRGECVVGRRENMDSSPATEDGSGAGPGEGVAVVSGREEKERCEKASVDM